MSWCNVYELQEQHGVHRNTIAKHLKSRGLVLGKQPLTPAEIRKAGMFYEQGMSWNEIGRMLGRDPKTIKLALICTN